MPYNPATQSPTLQLLPYDPATQSPTIQLAASRSYWKQKANEAIGWKEGGKYPGAIEMNRRITAQYAETYLRDPNKFVWAGMAAFASNEVGEGMKKLEVLGCDRRFGRCTEDQKNKDHGPQGVTSI